MSRGGTDTAQLSRNTVRHSPRGVRGIETPLTTAPTSGAFLGAPDDVVDQQLANALGG